MADPTQPETPPQPTDEGSIRRALIVDDDQGVLRMLKNWLTGLGYEVEGFDRFEPAKVQVMRSPPDVLITDVRLGAFNGLQLVVLAKAAHPDILAIVLTGFDDPVLQKEAADAGALYMPKPIRFEQMIEVLQTWTSVIS